jgi:methylenetetrahydrofolate dehydrogenase (NADP+)/methenyltetrahydrofolate cyclohydrolase
MKILDGKKLSAEILEEAKKEIAEKHLKLKVAVVFVGNDPASEIFIRQKEKACLFCGIDFELFKFPSNIGLEELKKEMGEMARDPKISGIIVQLPLPGSLKTQGILNLIPPEKDIDVLTEANLGKFYTSGSLILPPVVGGVCHFLEEYKISLEGKKVVIIGAGKLVGFPSALWFFGKKATVSVVNEFTTDRSSFTKEADIIVSGVGKPGLIRGDMVKNGAIVIDVGSGFKNGKISGDVDFESVSKKAGYVSPVPNGMGPMTVACLIENLLKISIGKP